MDVYCPACGKKGRIDDAKIPDAGIFARCPECKKRLWINKTDGVSLPDEPSSQNPAASAGQVGGAPTPQPPSADSTGKNINGLQAGQPSPPPAPADPPPPAQGPVSPAPGQQIQPPVPAPKTEQAGFEITPLQSPVDGQAPPTPKMEQPSGVPCSICGNRFSPSDVVRFGDKTVCASCKPQYVQMMKTGVSAPGAFVYGGFWIRFVAKIIDGIILGIAQGIIIIPLIFFMVKSFIGKPEPEMLPTFFATQFLIQFVSIAMGAAYTTFFIGRYRATPGKMAFGLKVIMPDGGRVSYWRAFGRHFAEMISAFILLIGYIMAGFDSQKRSLHDRICSTRVVKN